MELPAEFDPTARRMTGGVWLGIVGLLSRNGFVRELVTARTWGMGVHLEACPRGSMLTPSPTLHCIRRHSRGPSVDPGLWILRAELSGQNRWPKNRWLRAQCELCVNSRDADRGPGEVTNGSCAWSLIFESENGAVRPLLGAPFLCPMRQGLLSPIWPRQAAAGLRLRNPRGSQWPRRWRQERAAGCGWPSGRRSRAVQGAMQAAQTPLPSPSFR